MNIQIDNNSIVCNCFKDYKEQIRQLLTMDSSEIWISENSEQDELPCISDKLQWDEL